jgi:hypothetical protein
MKPFWTNIFLSNTLSLDEVMNNCVLKEVVPGEKLKVYMRTTFKINKSSGVVVDVMRACHEMVGEL